jgi:hypothetical protein
MEKEKLEKLKRDVLLRLAKENQIKGRTKMKKKELINTLFRFFKAKEKRKKEEKIETPRIRRIRKKPILRKKKKKIKKTIPTLAKEKQKVEKAKFELGPQLEEITTKPQEFIPQTQVAVEEKPYVPQTYGEDRLTLLVRDPWWIFAYWEITPQTWEKVRRGIGKEISLKNILRVYDVTGISEFTGENANSFFDIELTPFADNWYIHVGNPNRSYCADIGLKDPQGKFYKIIRSNLVTTPRYGMSEILDEEWMLSEEEYWKLFGLSGGYGIGKGSLEVQELFKKRFEEEISSGFPTSVFSWMQRESQRGFWLIADAELIIYGATEKDAKLSIQGKAHRLRKDGTFSIRFALPDGKQVIPIEATSNDSKEKKQITITVSRKTS